MAAKDTMDIKVFPEHQKGLKVMLEIEITRQALPMTDLRALISKLTNKLDTMSKLEAAL